MCIYIYIYICLSIHLYMHIPGRSQRTFIFARCHLPSCEPCWYRVKTQDPTLDSASLNKLPKMFMIHDSKKQNHSWHDPKSKNANATPTTRDFQAQISPTFNLPSDNLLWCCHGPLAPAPPTERSQPSNLPPPQHDLRPSLGRRSCAERHPWWSQARGGCGWPNVERKHGWKMTKLTRNESPE